MDDQKRTTGSVRAELYDFLRDEGFNVTDKRHARIRSLIKEHSRLDNESMYEKASQSLNALQNTKVSPKGQTIIKRFKDFHCPICGIPMKNRGNGEHVTECGHLSDVMFAYA